ncbi:MAG: sulfotransferase, partial [Alphaproteobacteria bacterium]
MDERAQLMRALTLQPMLDGALREAGASEFRDTSFIPALEQALQIPLRLTMSVRGLQGVHANFTRFLVTRLRYEADVAKHPEILDEDVSDPVVVLGWARSGTTKLQRFLSADPRFQPTPAWAMFNPAPFPGEKPGDPTPRREWANAMMNAVTNCNDSYQVMHEFEADEADETSFIPLGNFDSPSQCVTTPEPVFAAWSRTQSRVPSIEYTKKMLQYLQWQQGGRRGPYLIKNPLNTGELAEMAEVFPNATFVTSKRDLVTTMGSCMRMMSEILTNTFDPLDLHMVGTITVEQAVHELNRYVQQRAALKGKVRLLEISYGRAVKDAMNVASL